MITPDGTREEHIAEKARYLTIAETKKLLVAAVRKAFPGIAFRFTTRNAVLSVEWTDGPAWRKVRQITKIFTNRGTVDNSDYVPPVDTWYQGELVYFGNSSVNLERHFSHEAIEIVTRRYQQWSKCAPFEIVGESLRGKSKFSAIDWSHPHRDTFYKIIRVLDEGQFSTFNLKIHSGYPMVDQPLCIRCNDDYIDHPETHHCDACASILAERARLMALIEAPLPGVPLEMQLHLIRQKYYACLQVIDTFGDNRELHETYHEHYMQCSYNFEEQANRVIAQIEAQKQSGVINFSQARSRLQQRRNQRDE
jgi:hypothetical protein